MTPQERNFECCMRQVDLMASLQLRTVVSINEVAKGGTHQGRRVNGKPVGQFRWQLQYNPRFTTGFYPTRGTTSEVRWEPVGISTGFHCASARFFLKVDSKQPSIDLFF